MSGFSYRSPEDVSLGQGAYIGCYGTMFGLPFAIVGVLIIMLTQLGLDRAIVHPPLSYLGFGVGILMCCPLFFFWLCALGAAAQD